MKVIYYFSKNRLEKDKIVVKSIYGNEVTFINEKPGTVAGMLDSGDILICNSVDELIDVKDIINNSDMLVKEYMSLYERGIELVFDKSTQCNSLFIKTIVSNEQTFEFVLKKCILNYANQKTLENKYSRKHIVTARLNGKKVGIKKGTKLVTKKSIEMKEKIKELSKDFDGSLNDDAIMKKLKISRNSYYKYKKQIKDGGK